MPSMLDRTAVMAVVLASRSANRGLRQGFLKREKGWWAFSPILPGSVKLKVQVGCLCVPGGEGANLGWHGVPGGHGVSSILQKLVTVPQFQLHGVDAMSGERRS